jgi:hypothetical protein
MLIWNDAAFFLPMAIADKALWGYDSLDDLQRQKIPPGDDVLPLRWDEAALDRPVLRKCTKADGVTEERMPKAAFVDIYKTSLRNSGYPTTASIHAIRRHLGKKVDGELSSFTSQPGAAADRAR